MVCKRSGIPNPGFLLTSHRLHCSSSPATESLFTFKTNVAKNFFSSHLWILLHNPHFHSQTEKFCTFQSVVLDILHSTHSLFSDWPKAYNEFSKSAPGKSSSCRLYNNHVKILGNHIMYDRCAWFLRVVMSSLCSLCCLLSVMKTQLPHFLWWLSKTSKK